MKSYCTFMIAVHVSSHPWFIQSDIHSLQHDLSSVNMVCMTFHLYHAGNGPCLGYRKKGQPYQWLKYKQVFVPTTNRIYLLIINEGGQLRSLFQSLPLIVSGFRQSWVLGVWTSPPWPKAITRILYWHLCPEPARGDIISLNMNQNLQNVILQNISIIVFFHFKYPTLLKKR